MDYSGFNITFPGQKVTICNRLIKQFRDEHNNNALGADFDTSRVALDALLPSKYHDKRVVWLKQYWHKVMPDISKADRPATTAAMNLSYNKYTLFAAYQRNQYTPTVNRLFRDRELALKECESDIFHNPTWADYQTNGLPSKNPNANPSTNIGYLKRLKKLNNLTEDQLINVSNTITQIRADAENDTFFDGNINIDDYRLTKNTPLPPDPLEDFTTYTEVDPATYFDVATNTITITAMPRNINAYIHKDFGAGHFTDFEHLHSFNPVNNPIGNGRAFVWGLANETSVLTSSTGVGGYMLFDVANPNYIITDISLATSDASSTFAKNVQRWATTSRNGTTLQTALYSNVDRTVAFDTVSVTCAATAFRNLYAVSSANVGGVDSITGFVYDLDTQEGHGFGVAGGMSYFDSGMSEFKHFDNNHKVI